MNDVVLVVVLVVVGVSLVFGVFSVRYCEVIDILIGVVLMVLVNVRLRLVCL